MANYMKEWTIIDEQAPLTVDVFACAYGLPAFTAWLAYEKESTLKRVIISNIYG